MTFVLMKTALMSEMVGGTTVVLSVR